MQWRWSQKRTRKRQELGAIFQPMPQRPRYMKLDLITILKDPSTQKEKTSFFFKGMRRQAYMPGHM